MQLKTLKNSIIFYSVGLSLVTCIVIGLYLNNHYNRQIETLAHEKLALINKTIIEKASNYLMPAVKMAETSAHLFENYVLYYTLPLQLEFYTLSIIKPFPQLASAYFGDARGNFIMTKRLPNKTLETTIINTEENTTTIKTYNLFNNIIDTKTEKNIIFDPRKRPWFKGTKKLKASYWTDVYTFFSDKKPGITAGYPIFNKYDQFYGVFGIDIRLKKIAEFLNIHNASEKAVTFIINDKDKIVIHSKNSQLNGKKIETLDKINTKVIQLAFQHNAKKSNHKFKFSYKDTLYYASFSNFPKYFEKKWQLVSIAPKDELLSEKSNASYLIYSICIFILLLSSFLGILLGNRVKKYFEAIVYDLKRLRESNSSIKLNTKSDLAEVKEIVEELDKLNKQ